MRFRYKLEYVRMFVGVGFGIYAAYRTWGMAFGEEFPEEPLLLSLAAGLGSILYVGIMSLAGAWVFDKLWYLAKRMLVRRRRGAAYAARVPATAPPADGASGRVEDTEKMKALARKMIRLG